MAERPLWTPSPERIEEANLTRFARQAIRDWKLGLNDYPAFYRWTIAHPEQFWDSLWRFASVRASAKGARVLVNGDRMPARAGIRRRGSTSPRTCCGGATRPRRLCSGAKTR